MRICLAVLAALLLLTVPALADFLPTHGLGPHLNPFAFGWVPSGIVGPAANGSDSELILPFSASVPWSPLYTAPATDAIDSNGPDLDWHWESEYDFLGLAGFIPVSFFGRAPVPVLFGPGIDIYIDIHQFDLGNSAVLPPGTLYNVPAQWGFCGVGFGEVGSVCKQTVNLTSLYIAWGTSVTETPDEIVAGEDKVVILAQTGQRLTFSEANTNHNILQFSGDATNGFSLTEDIPEPASPALVGLGLIVLGLAGRRLRL